MVECAPLSHRYPLLINTAERPLTVSTKRWGAGRQKQPTEQALNEILLQ